MEQYSLADALAHDPPVRVDAESVEEFWEGDDEANEGTVCAPG